MENTEVIKVVRIECKSAGTLALHLLEPLQGELKSLSKEDYERLRNEIIKDGFSEPLSVWEDPGSGKTFILNGHQRHRVLKALKEEGWEVPPVPVSYVEASDIAKAKHKLLALASQYGKVEQQGLYEFVSQAGITIEDLATDFKFPEIDIQSFIENFFVDKEAEQAVSGAVEEKVLPDSTAVRGEAPEGVDSTIDLPVSPVKQVQLFYNEDEQKEFIDKADKLQSVLGKDNMSDTIMELLREAYRAKVENQS